MTRSLLVAALLLGAAPGCKKSHSPLRPAPIGIGAESVRAPDPGAALSAPPVGEAQYEAELGALHERYGQWSEARAAYRRALDQAAGQNDRLRLLLALARVADGNKDGLAAQAHLTAALALIDEKVARPVDAVRLPPFEYRALVLRLGALHLARGDAEAAEHLYARLLEEDPDGDHGEIHRARAALWRRAGTFDEEVAKLERAAAKGKAREPALRALVAIYGADARTLVAAPVEPPAALVRAYEGLLELHPDDGSLRQVLAQLYEQSGRVDDALALVKRTPAAATPSGLDACAVPAPSPALAAREAAVRLLQRNDRGKQAIAEAVAIGALPEVPAKVLSARLLEELGDEAQAEAALTAARQAAGSAAAERRMVFGAEGAAMIRRGDRAGLAKLSAEAQASGDPCLRGGVAGAAPGAVLAAAIPQGVPR